MELQWLIQGPLFAFAKTKPGKLVIIGLIIKNLSGLVVVLGDLKFVITDKMLGAISTFLWTPKGHAIYVAIINQITNNTVKSKKVWKVIGKKLREDASREEIWSIMVDAQKENKSDFDSFVREICGAMPKEELYELIKDQVANKSNAINSDPISKLYGVENNLREKGEVSAANYVKNLRKVAAERMND